MHRSRRKQETLDLDGCHQYFFLRHLGMRRQTQCPKVPAPIRLQFCNVVAVSSDVRKNVVSAVNCGTRSDGSENNRILLQTSIVSPQFVLTRQSKTTI